LHTLCTKLFKQLIKRLPFLDLHLKTVLVHKLDRMPLDNGRGC
jgi:hypothetical protein